MSRGCAIGVAIAAVLVAPAGVVGAAGDDTEPDGSVPATSIPGSSIPAGEPTAGPPPGDIDFQIDMILGLVPEDEMDDYFRDQEARQQVAIQECMNEAGFEYEPEDTGVFFEDPFAELSPLEYAEQWGFGAYTTMDPESNMFSDVGQDFVSPNQEIVEALSASEQNAWYELLNSCSNDARMEDDPYSNPMVQQAIEDFFTDVENDPRTRDALEAWQACMEEAGHPFASEQDMWDTVFDQDLIDEFYQTSAWEPDSPNHGEWQAMVDQEIGIAVANANCGPAVQEAREGVIADLRPALVEFWQTIDWSLPPVTYPGEDEMLDMTGELIEEVPISSVEEGPRDSAGAPVAIDLSDPVETSAPPTSDS